MSLASRSDPPSVPSQGMHTCVTHKRLAGSITAEALILLPVLTLVFGLAIYMAYRYQAEVRLNQQARTRLWSQALPGCGTGVLDSQRLAYAAPVPTQMQALAPRASQFFSTILWQHMETKLESQVKRPSSLGQGNKRLSATMHVSCNEVVRPTEQDLWQVIQEAFCKTGAC